MAHWSPGISPPACGETVKGERACYDSMDPSAIPPAAHLLNACTAFSSPSSCGRRAVDFTDGSVEP